MRIGNFAKALALVLSVSLFASSASAAITLSTADGNGADVTLSNDGNQSQGSNINGGSMNIRHFVGTRLKMAYFRFDISGVSGDLSGATITLFPTSSNRDRTFNVFGVVDGATGGLGENWDESLITYSTAAGIDLAGSGVNDGTFAFSSEMTGILTTMSITSGSSDPVVSLTDTALDNFLAADTDGLVTFAVLTSISDSNQNFFFSSKESTGATGGPQLFLPNAVPEPSSFALLGLAGFGLARRRRR